MPTLMLDGRAVRTALIPALADRVKGLIVPPVLAIFQVGDRADSTAFIKAKMAFGAKIGVPVKHVHLPEGIGQQELIAQIKQLNADASIHGIIVQLPLPIALDQDAVIESIDPRKDVDSLTSYNIKRWMEGREDALWPATTRGVKELLAHYMIDLSGKRVAVVGRSLLVGTPLAAFCTNEGAKVIVCHSKTPDVAAETKRADVLIVAVGKPRLIGADHVKEGAVVIDVGINREGEKLIGDVDFDAVQPIAGAITPVPGGVGAMTVLALFENLVDLCLR